MGDSNQIDLFSEFVGLEPTPGKESFGEWFKALTGHPPFRWQTRLFGRLTATDLPAMLDLPTGLGKTSILAVWLLARACNPRLPRRLVYVVDRRAVVDQATAEAEQLREALAAVPDLAERLGLKDRPLPVSTLRGQHADNRDWLADPTLPAIVVGTLDMIGSRLLFEGYGVSRGMRPYQAGLLGADTWLVLDEAHLCPPFEALLRAVPAVGSAGRAEGGPIPPFHLLSLSATGRDGNGTAFRLIPDDEDDAIVQSRLKAEKRLAIQEESAKDAAALVAALVGHALEYAGENRRVVIFCDRREDAKKVGVALGKRQIELLTGARRVYEREELAQRLKDWGFLAGSDKTREAPVFLVATSAGEVGIDLDADHLVCDWVAFERMVQRLGRVNRRGEGAARIAVIGAPASNKEKPADTAARLARLRAPFDALPDLGEGCRDASPGAFLALRQRAATDPALREAIQAASTPPPLHPELTRAVADAWSMTSLPRHAGRPDIQPWLRGWIEDDKPQTLAVWREHLPPDPADIEAFFEAAPVHLSETLEASTGEVLDTLIKRAKALAKAAASSKSADSPDAKPPLRPADVALLLLDRNGQPKPWGRGGAERLVLTVGELANLAGKDKEAVSAALVGAHAVIRRGLGGLNGHGLLDEGAADPPETTLDHGWPEERLREGVGYRVRLDKGEPTESAGWRVSHRFQRAGGESDEANEDDTPDILIEVYRGTKTPRQGDFAVSREPQRLDKHHAWAGEEADKLARALELPDDYRSMFVAAAEAHDLGKDRALWQDAMNAPKDGHRPYAKTRGGGDPRRLCGYRHEFGSLGDVENFPPVQGLPDELKDLALHLIASHHGHARPVIAPIDPHAPPSRLAARAEAAALRFARLQRRWGPWGLAWWEAVFRAADWRASQRLDDESNPQETPK